MSIFTWKVCLWGKLKQYNPFFFTVVTTGELSDKLTNRKESVIELCLYFQKVVVLEVNKLEPRSGPT